MKLAGSKTETFSSSKTILLYPKRKEIRIGLSGWDSRAPQTLVCCVHHSNAHHCCDIIKCVQHVTSPLLGEDTSRLFHQQLSFASKHPIHCDNERSKVLSVLLASLEVLLLFSLLLCGKMVLDGAILVGLHIRVSDSDINYAVCLVLPETTDGDVATEFVLLAF
eukprot:11692686-Ditylum_brightwellii.AAC.1